MAEPKKPPPLSSELLKYFQGLAAPAQRQTSGTQYERDGFMPVYDTNWASSPESAAGNDDQPGNLVNIVGPGFNPKDPNNHAAYDKDTGEFSHWYTANTGVSPELLFALATGGLMMLPGGLLAAAGGAGGAGLAGAEGAGALAGGAAGDALGAGLLEAGAGFGGAELGSGMFLDGGAMLGMGSGSALPAGLSLSGAAPGFMGGLAGSELAMAGAGLPMGNAGFSGAGGAGGSGGGSTNSAFNAAKDSQLANETIGAGAIDGYQAGASSWLDNLLPKGVTDALGGAKGIGGLLGSVLGAASSKDQEQTSSRAPWEPAQPWIKDNIAKGQQLQSHYEANPFNDVQKRGLQGLLDANAAGRQALPGLLDFANRLGQTNYQRSGGRNLAYSAPSSAAPGLLGFGTASAPAVDWGAMNPLLKKG